MKSLKKLKKLIKKCEIDCTEAGLKDYLDTLKQNGFQIIEKQKEEKDVSYINTFEGEIGGFNKGQSTTFETLQDAVQDWYNNLQDESVCTNEYVESKLYTESGEYLLSTQRQESILQTAYENMKYVHDSDLANWKESLKL
jgi:hypothetical protein